MINKIDINENALYLRKLFGEDSNSPIDIFSLLNDSDEFITIFYVCGGDNDMGAN